MRLTIAAVVLVGLVAAPASAVWYENFDSYANGGLDPVGNPTWTGNPAPTTGVIDVVSDVWRSPEKSCRVTMNAPGVSATAVTNQTMVNNQLTLTWWVKGDFVNTIRGSYLRAQCSATDNTGCGDWWPSAGGATPRIDGVGRTLAGVVFVQGWNELKTVVKFDTGWTDYYFNGAYWGTMQWGDLNPGQTQIYRVIIERYPRADAVGAHLWIDDISITPEPTALILLGLGGLLGLRRRR